MWLCLVVFKHCTYQLIFVIPAVASSAAVDDDVKASRFELGVGFVIAGMMHHRNMTTNKQTLTQTVWSFNDTAV